MNAYAYTGSHTYEHAHMKTHTYTKAYISMQTHKLINCDFAQFSLEEKFLLEANCFLEDNGHFPVRVHLHTYV